MISVLTMTYQRHHVLEEAIQSFLLQDFDKPCEMVILNDSPQVKYTINNPKVRIINFDTRFSSIEKKIESGYKYCLYDHIYRLDDDDLLAPNALNFVYDAISNFPNNEVYRSKGVYFFGNNRFHDIASNVNNGNFYKKSYLDRITFGDDSFGEDVRITHGFGGLTHYLEKPTMIYRWGGPSYHISAWGNQKTEKVLADADRASGLKEIGVIELNPHFNGDYWSILPLSAQTQDTITTTIFNSVCEICGGTGKIKRMKTMIPDPKKPHLKRYEMSLSECVKCKHLNIQNIIKKGV